MNKHVDVGLAVVIILLGATILIATEYTVRSSPVVRDPLGPRGFAFGVGALMTALGAVLLPTQIRKWKDFSTSNVPSEGTPDSANTEASAIRALAIICAAFIYGVALEYAGYMLATTLFLLATLKIMGRHMAVVNTIYSLVFSVVTYLVFAIGLRAPLPTVFS